jgi:SAM-dependent methyltransferase
MHIAVRWLFALLLVLGGATTVGSLAQTAPEAPGDHTLKGDHHSGGHSDRGYHRSFDQAEKWAKEFDDPSRDAWQKPNEVLDALHLDRTARVADLGAGTGYFSARIARLIPEGKLFAVDIEPDMLRFLGERAQREHLSVLMPVLASAGSPNLPEPVDLVLVVDTYHHIDDALHTLPRCGHHCVRVDDLRSWTSRRIRQTGRRLSIASQLNGSRQS